MIARARALETESPEDAGASMRRPCSPSPASLEAHNALERLGVIERYSAWMLVNCVIDPRDDIFHFS
jgi:hypothetical protein